MTDFEFLTLSSGEREVVNIAFDFLLRNPRDCVVFFDEPELHLHPELSHKLILALQEIGSSNQFIFSTHSPDIISASLEQSVLFVGPRGEENGQPSNQAIAVRDDDETNQALRLLGHSIGIIALGKRIVLIEGDSSSLDKRTYGSILRDRFPDLVLVPSGGKHVIQSFGTIHEAVLSRTLWGVDFFMLCDGDSAPPGVTPGGESSPRLRVLPRYHLENYFLDEKTWASAFAVIEEPDSWLRSPPAIHEALVACARELISYATALKIAASIRLNVGNVDIMPKDCHGKSANDIASLISTKAEDESKRVRSHLGTAQLSKLAKTIFSQLEASLDDGTDSWKTSIPGKPLLGRFLAKAGVGKGRGHTMYLAARDAGSFDPFEEIVRLFGEFAASE